MDAQGWRFERQVGLGLVLTIVLQTVGALLWAGATAERIEQLDERVRTQAGVAERLARLEEQAVFNRAVLTRIEAKLDAEEGRR
jgi:uncharacterized membrane protein YjjP (DUF1212 family)